MERSLRDVCEASHIKNLKFNIRFVDYTEADSERVKNSAKQVIVCEPVPCDS
jgi:hypothetical protein